MCSSSENSWQLKKCSVVGADHETQSKKAVLFEDEENIPSCSILSLIVKDPRTLSKQSIADGTATVINNNVPEDEAKEHVTLPDISEKSEVLLSSSTSKAKWNDNLHDDKDMWDANSRMCLPVEESILCLEKHHSRMDLVCLDYPKAGMPKTPTELQSSRCCPTLLLENRNSKGLLMGWSLILPLSWARVFWISIISKGAHAIGLQEKRWVACDVGLPDFPSDFPDCNAYSYFMVAEGANIKQNAEKLPPSVRPFKVPIPSPWNVVRATVHKGLLAMGDMQHCGDEVMADRNSLSNSKCCDCNTKPHSSLVNSLDGIVARTSCVLTDFLSEIHGDCLLLFPGFQNKTGILEFMMDENKFGNGGSQITSDRKLCYLRVLLHAYKEGVFEEGAVVCAPVLGDILLWTSRSENIEGGLQIPQSSVRSYFKQQLCGNWEFQISQDPVSRGSHRWPIGFVTTGFVRGSKKPVAEAFCEATLLARLRQEQWKRMPEKQRRTEIYVLVRNLRSSAYRLGLATIVLEQQVDDVGFL
uniref:Uncharacterized protein LOC105138000 n=1 Tax=Rhizophora mucronata TaxID=61149 RepID=A0A2P2L4N0_RHIMU